MENDLLECVRRYLAEFDASVGAEPARLLHPHSAAELDAAEAALGMALPAAYRAFLGEFGGCWVGMSVHGLRNGALLESRSMLELTRDFLADGWPLPQPCCVFSFDGSGNPIWLDATGQVFLHDHDVGQTTLLAPNFETLMHGLLT